MQQSLIRQDTEAAARMNLTLLPRTFKGPRSPGYLGVRR
jgi:hypothetical protein